jgi:hypothetical protein
MIEPTVGRVVWYRPNEHDAKQLHAGDQPLAAHVAYVHSTHLVNLLVIDPNGTDHARTSVSLVQDGHSISGGSSYCEWMSYQKGQAAKTEALEAKGAT